MPQVAFHGERWHFEVARIMEDLATANDRRETQRFSINAPLTVTVGDREISAYTRDLSNGGVYFYLSLADGLLIDQDFEFVVELPPEITLSTGCRIQCRGRLVRTENASMHLTGMAAKILEYSIQRGVEAA